MRGGDRRTLSAGARAVKQVQSSIRTSYPKVPPLHCIAASEACLEQVEVVVDSEVSLLLPHGAATRITRIVAQQRRQGMWHQKRHWLRLKAALDRQPRLCSLPDSTVRALLDNLEINLPFWAMPNRDREESI